MRTLIMFWALGAFCWTSSLEAQSRLSTSDDLPHEERACERVTLVGSAKPKYTVSASWIAPDQLVIVDAVRNNLLRIGLRGELLGWQSPRVDAKVSEVLSTSFLPVAAESTDDGVWVELTGTRMVKLWGGFSYQVGVDLWGLDMHGKARLIGIFDWTIAGDDLFGFGSFRLMEPGRRGEKAVGFFRVNLSSLKNGAVTDYRILDVGYASSREGGDDTGDGKPVEYMPVSNPMHLWYRLGQSYTTSIGSTGYALLIFDSNGDGIPRTLGLVESQQGESSLVFLGTFTSVLQDIPELPEFEHATDQREVMNGFQAVTAPAGLYSWGKKLVLLWRWVADDRSRWILSVIDPHVRTEEGRVRPRVESQVVVNSPAAHLVVAPGPDRWAFIEKGPVSGFGIQSVDTVLFVPAEILSASFSAGGVLCP